jgi:hypothetical protein
MVANVKDLFFYKTNSFKTNANPFDLPLKPINSKKVQKNSKGGAKTCNAS